LLQLRINGFDNFDYLSFVSLIAHLLPMYKVYSLYQPAIEIVGFVLNVVTYFAFKNACNYFISSTLPK